MNRLALLALLLLTGIIPFTTLAQKDPTGYFSSFDKAKIYYEVKGTGKPVLLIHGYSNKGSDWKKKPLYVAWLQTALK